MPVSKRATTKSTAKKTGRPKSTGAGTPTMVRLHAQQLKAIDSWIGDADISRPEAIRQLVSWALDHTKKTASQPAHETHAII